MSALAFPPFFVSFSALPLNLIGVRRFVDNGQCDRGHADEAPLLLRLFDKLADYQGDESADGARPVPSGAGRTMMLPGIMVIPAVIDIMMWLCCARFHFARRLWRGHDSVKNFGVNR
jgi:hypothetical protein